MTIIIYHRHHHQKHLTNDAMVMMFCQGDSMSPRDQLLQASFRLQQAAHQRRETVEYCQREYDRAMRLVGKVKPKNDKKLTSQEEDDENESEEPASEESGDEESEENESEESEAEVDRGNSDAEATSISSRATRRFSPLESPSSFSAALRYIATSSSIRLISSSSFVICSSA